MGDRWKLHETLAMKISQHQLECIVLSTNLSHQRLKRNLNPPPKKKMGLPMEYPKIQILKRLPLNVSKLKSC